MSKLDKLIIEWRKSMTAAGSPEMLDEMENHLRENVDQFVRSGVTESEAFQRAVGQLGGAHVIASEFKKLDQGTWLPVKLVSGLGALLAVAQMVLQIVQVGAGRINFLLASHVFLVGVGYMTTLLIGVLGICFIGQRCFSNFSPARMRSLTRVTFLFGCVAASLTALGISAAMIWAKAEWGRYWAWDIREVGAFIIILWQVLFLLAHRFLRGTVRGILTMSLLGNIVVSLGWFGSNLVSRPQGEWALYYGLFLVVGVLFNLAFFITGLAPAGWLRLRS